ncbi:MAG: vitamin B12 dependent methionine synthase [Anaerolineaceae bacterium]|nr:vitamin B12 dependent methionine synthase [Anaerolineaceae bacterium]
MIEQFVTHVLDNIPFDPDLPWLFKRLRIKEGSVNHTELGHLIDQARPIGRPKALYQVSYITDRSEEWVEIQGERFNSRVLSVNLKNSHRVFPYLATCGSELQEWAASFDDMLLNYWAEIVKEAALFNAIRVLFESLDQRYRPGHTASMSPGSLQDWPIQQQTPLFHLFGGYTAQIGVRLTDSLLIVPTKTVSGIRFPTEADFESCELCPREGCPGRRAVYNAELYDSRYCRQNGLGQEKN